MYVWPEDSIHLTSERNISGHVNQHKNCPTFLGVMLMDQPLVKWEPTLFFWGKAPGACCCQQTPFLAPTLPVVWNYNSSSPLFLHKYVMVWALPLPSSLPLHKLQVSNYVWVYCIANDFHWCTSVWRLRLSHCKISLRSNTNHSDIESPPSCVIAFLQRYRFIQKHPLLCTKCTRLYTSADKIWYQRSIRYQCGIPHRLTFSLYSVCCLNVQ